MNFWVTCHRISNRSKEENQWNNIWKKAGPYWDLYEQNQYKQPPKLRNEEAIQADQEKFIEEENTKEKATTISMTYYLQPKNKFFWLTTKILHNYKLLTSNCAISSIETKSS